MGFTRIRSSLANDEGAAAPLILAIVSFIIIGFAVLYQVFYATAILNTVRDSCRFVAESVLIANAESSYQAKRDGYTGVWHLDGEDVTDPTIYIDVSESLAQQLRLINGYDVLIKTDGNKEIYHLNNIHLTIDNPGFQVDSASLKANISLDIVIYLNFPFVGSYPVTVPLNVSAAWNPKF